MRVRRGAGRGPCGGGARRQAVHEQADALARHALGGHRPGRVVPAADPAQRAGQGEGGELRIAGGERALGHALLDQRAEFVVDLRLEPPQLAAAVGGEGVLADADQAHAEVHRHDQGVLVHRRLELVERAAARARGLGDGRAHQLEPVPHALEQDLFLAAHVVVERRLGDGQPLGDHVERGRVIALVVEQLCRGAQHGVALDRRRVARAAVGRARPGRCGSGSGGASQALSPRGLSSGPCRARRSHRAPSAARYPSVTSGSRLDRACALRKRNPMQDFPSREPAAVPARRSGRTRGAA